MACLKAIRKAKEKEKNTWCCPLWFSWIFEHYSWGVAWSSEITISNHLVRSEWSVDVYYHQQLHVKTNFLELATSNFSKAAQHLQYHEQHSQVQQENAGRCQNPKPQGWNYHLYPSADITITRRKHEIAEPGRCDKSLSTIQPRSNPQWKAHKAKKLHNLVTSNWVPKSNNSSSHT